MVACVLGAVRRSGWRCACSGDLWVEDADVVALLEKNQKRASGGARRPGEKDGHDLRLAQALTSPENEEDGDGNGGLRRANSSALRHDWKGDKRGNRDGV